MVFVTNALNGGGAERSLLEVYKHINRYAFAPDLWRLIGLNMYPDYIRNDPHSKLLKPLRYNRENLSRVKHSIKLLPAQLKKAGLTRYVPDALLVSDRLAHEMDSANDSSEFALPIVVSSQQGMNLRCGILDAILKKKAPLIFIEQNDPYLRYIAGEPPEKAKVAWPGIKCLYPRATRIIAVSQAIKHSLIKRFGIASKLVSVIYNPVDIKRVRGYIDGLRPTHSFFYSGDPVLVCVARMHPQKNHHLLLRAFAMARRTKKIKLLMIGTGVIETSVSRAIEEMGLQREAEILSFRDPTPYIAHATLFVLASHHEGHPLAMLEAMACGVPVVSTDWPGVKEIMTAREDGVVSKMTDIAYANALLEGLDMASVLPAKRRLPESVAACDSVLIARQYEQLFLQV